MSFVRNDDSLTIYFLLGQYFNTEFHKIISNGNYLIQGACRTLSFGYCRYSLCLLRNYTRCYN